MLERFECVVCHRYVSMDIDNPLHYTNWNLNKTGTMGETVPVCSESCKEVAVLRHDLMIKEMQARDQSMINDRAERLNKVYLILGDSDAVEKNDRNAIRDLWYEIKDILDEDEF